MFLAVSTWFIALVSLTGVLLNLFKKRSGFYFWLVSNGFWVAVDLYYGIYAQAALFFVYWCLALWGALKWK